MLLCSDATDFAYILSPEELSEKTAGHQLYPTSKKWRKYLQVQFWRFLEGLSEIVRTHFSTLVCKWQPSEKSLPLEQTTDSQKAKAKAPRSQIL